MTYQEFNQLTNTTRIWEASEHHGPNLVLPECLSYQEAFLSGNYVARMPPPRFSVRSYPSGAVDGVCEYSNYVREWRPYGGKG